MFHVLGFFALFLGCGVGILAGLDHWMELGRARQNGCEMALAKGKGIGIELEQLGEGCEIVLEKLCEREWGASFHEWHNEHLKRDVTEILQVKTNYQPSSGSSSIVK